MRDAYVDLIEAAMQQPLRAARWETGDAVWVRREKDGPYERLTASDADALRAEFDAHGRAGVLDA
jgi:hypothetical protein